MIQKAKRIVVLTGGVLFLSLIILYMSGFFRTGVIDPDDQTLVNKQQATPVDTYTVEKEIIPQFYEAVGTVVSEKEAVISAQVNGRIINVAVSPGGFVSKGDLLIQLDDREAKSRFAQAKQALIIAEAEHDRAKQNLLGAEIGEKEAKLFYDRVLSYYKQKTATKESLEQAESRFFQARSAKQQSAEMITAARAGIEQAKKVIEGALVALGYYKITAPTDGTIAKRHVDPGEMALPGKPLLLIHTQGELRFKASIREGLINRVKEKMKLNVFFDAINTQVTGMVDEIEPVGDQLSRSFSVKVKIPDSDDLYPGMFGRLYLPLDARGAILVPRSALTHIGQLTTVSLFEGGETKQIYVKPGKQVREKVEVQSGLQGGEVIVTHR